MLLQGSKSQEVVATWQELTSCNLTWPEVTSFGRKSSGSGCRRSTTRVLGVFMLLQGCNSHLVAVTWKEMTSHDLKWLEVTRKWRHLTGSHREVDLEGRNSRILYICLLTRLYLAVGGSHVTTNYVRSPQLTEMTRKWHLTDSHQEVAVEGRKLAYTVHFTSYKAVASSSRQSRDRKCCHVTSGDRKWPGSHVIWRKSPASGCRRPKTRIYCTFHFLQDCISQ